MGVFDGCKPRQEVLKSDLDDAIFAADFGHLIDGKAPAVYGNAAEFFQNTHPAKQLCRVVQAVFGRLADTKEAGATIRLSTGFGGGKTHTLMALWHLAHNIDDPSMGTELLPAAGRPKKVKLVAVDASKAGVPQFAKHGRIKVNSLWGEIFYQLGDEKELKKLGKADDPEASPNEDQIETALLKTPLLFLLDELVIYMAKLSDRGQGNLLGFLNSLASVVGRRKQAILIITDPGSQVAYAAQSAALAHGLSAQAITNAAARLDDIADRTVSDFDPIGDESARVIVRRLFERVDPAAAQSTSATYHALYERVVQESPGALPAEAATATYAKRIVECYPFHPRLLDTATDRLGALQDFHKSRGVLRLFARILRDVWESKEDPELVTGGEIDWASPRIRADLLDRLNRKEFRAAISADVKKHATELDGGKRAIHTRVASATLLESLPLTPSSGLDPVDVTLAVLRPDEAGPEPAEALDRLMGVCWHTYPTPSGRGCQFRYEPNILKQIEERMGDISVEDARSRVFAEAQGYCQGITFKLVPWPTSARQVPKTAALQLALCEDENIAKSVVAYEDDSDPAAPMPREFQNAVFALTATPTSLSEAVKRGQRLMAAEAIERENRSGESAKLVRDQLKKIMPELLKQFGMQTRRAFDRIVLPGGSVKRLDEKYQVGDETILKKPHGQICVRKFLDGHDLIYQPGDALDVSRFLKDVLPGSVPLPDQPQVYTAKAVHERFLGAPGLRLVPDGGIARQTVLNAVAEGKAAVRLADGRAYDASGCVEGPEGRRRRISDTLTTLTLDDGVFITPIDSRQAQEWLKVDKPVSGGTGGEGGGPGGGGPPPPPPPDTPSQVTATSWEKVLEYAEERPLLELHLIAQTPSDGAGLPPLVQPLGAEQLTASVAVGGHVKDGGMMNFAADGMRPNHPAKPLHVAQTIFNSLTEARQFEVDFKLTFGKSGRTGLEAQLQQIRDSAPEGVAVRALFDKPVEVTA